MISFLKIQIAQILGDKRFGEVLTGSALSLLARLVATGVTLLINVYIARYYGAESLGTLALVNAFLMLTTILTLFGTDISILRLIPEHATRFSISSAYAVYRKILLTVTVASVVCTVGFYLASHGMSVTLFHKPQLASILALTALFILAKSLATLTAQAARALKLIRLYSLLQMIPSLAMLGFLGGALWGDNPDLPIQAQLASWSIAAIMGGWLVYRVFCERIRSQDVVHIETSRQLLILSFPMMVSATMNFFIAQSGVIILGMLRSEGEVGIYSVAVKLANLTTFVLVSINTMAAPKFSELYHQNKLDDLFYVARQSARLIFWTTIPILLGLLILGRPILGYAFGNEFVAAYPAMVFLLIGQFVNSVSGSTGYFMNMTGEHKVFGRVMTLTALLNFVASFILGERFGMLGVACVSMLGSIVWNLYVLYHIKCKYGKSVGYFPAFWAR